MNTRILVYLIAFSLIIIVVAQTCGRYEIGPWPAITDISEPTPLSLIFIYTVTDCTRRTVETITLTAYVPDGLPYYAHPVALTSSGTYAVSTATFVFGSLLVDMLQPGEELYLEYIPKGSPNPTSIPIFTVSMTDAFSFPPETTSPGSGFSVSSFPLTTGFSTAVHSTGPSSAGASNLTTISQSKSVTPSIIAGIIGSVSAVFVIALLGWVVLKSKRFRDRSESANESKLPVNHERNIAISGR